MSWKPPKPARHRVIVVPDDRGDVQNPIAGEGRLSVDPATGLVLGREVLCPSGVVLRVGSAVAEVFPELRPGMRIFYARAMEEDQIWEGVRINTPRIVEPCPRCGGWIPTETIHAAVESGELRGIGGSIVCRPHAGDLEHGEGVLTAEPVKDQTAEVLSVGRLVRGVEPGALAVFDLGQGMRLNFGGEPVLILRFDWKCGHCGAQVRRPEALAVSEPGTRVQVGPAVLVC